MYKGKTLCSVQIMSELKKQQQVNSWEFLDSQAILLAKWQASACVCSHVSTPYNIHIWCALTCCIYIRGKGAFESSLHKFYKWSLSQGQGKAKMKNRKVKRRKLEINWKEKREKSRREKLEYMEAMGEKNTSTFHFYTNGSDLTFTLCLINISLFLCWALYAICLFNNHNNPVRRS